MMYSAKPNKARFQVGEVFFVSALNNDTASGWFCENGRDIYGPFQTRDEALSCLASSGSQAA